MGQERLTLKHCTKIDKNALMSITQEKVIC